jgi:RNA polymerase sigma-70 factor (ECF subfamily)
MLNMDKPVDMLWMENIKNDDYASYNQLFMRYYPILCLFVNRMLHDRHAAEDIVQELFIKLWTNRRKIHLQTTVSGYLYQTAKNMSLNFLRDEANRRTLLENKWEDELYLLRLPPEDHIYRESLEDCIRQLPTRCKEILLMNRVDGYKQKEIAEKLNISLQTVKNQIGTALQRLRNCLELKGIAGI